MTEATAEKKEMFYGEFGGQYVPAEIEQNLMKSRKNLKR